MLKIRLARTGKKNRPSFRIIISEDSKDTQADVLEILGFYNPLKKEVTIKKERVLYWMSVGAKASPSVHNILVEQGVIEGKKLKSSYMTKKRREKMKAKEEKNEEKPAETAAAKV